MLLLLGLGIPIGYAIGISSLVYVLLISDMSPLVIAQQVSSGADTMVLLALPFFLLAGEIMNAAGITKRLTRLALALIGPLPGGLSYVVVVANMLVAMVSGAAIASAAAVGSTMVPMMEKKGYPKGFPRRRSTHHRPRLARSSHPASDSSSTLRFPVRPWGSCFWRERCRAS